MDSIKLRNPNFEINTPLEFLLKNELLLDGDKISNACYLMFCKDENLFSTVQMGHFASEIVIKDDVSNSGDIIGQIEEVMSFVRKHINKEIIISDKQIENIQRWQYPLDGIRELVLNMIIHRDYTSSSDSQIKIFPDRILFFNPGSLPDSITIEQLLANTYVSTPRNRQIAKIVKEMGLIEKYGTGIKRVRRMFLDYGLHEPCFETIPGGFAVTIFSIAAGTSKNVNDPVNDPVNDRQKIIIKLIENDKFITKELIAEKCQVSLETIKRDIRKLKKLKLIKRVGSDKVGYWQVIVKP